MSTARVSWSVIIPAFNEAQRLPRYLEEIIAYFAAESGFVGSANACHGLPR